MKKNTLSPTLFLFLEFLILLPSLLFLAGIILNIVGNPFLLSIVISPTNILKNILVEFLSPIAGGFLAYNFLERYKPKGFWALKAKGILFYSIIMVGLIIASSLF